jgi:hypothetical protein
MWRILIEVWSLVVNTNTVKMSQNMVPSLTTTFFPMHHPTVLVCVRDYATSRTDVAVKLYFSWIFTL